MRALPVQGGILFAVWLLLLLGCCSANAVSKNENVAFAVGSGECSLCVRKNIQKINAVNGLQVSIGCKGADGKLEIRGSSELDKDGKFNVQLPNDLLDEKGELKHDCYAQLHSASKDLCPTKNGPEASKLVLKSKENGKHIFSTAGKLDFSPELCASASFLPKFKFNFKCPPFKKLPFPPIFKKPLPPPLPIYEPPPFQVYKKPPLYKPPVYKPPVFKKPPVYKPPVYEPPVFKKPPVYKPPVIKKPPVYKPPVITKPPVYKPPVITKPPVYKPPVIEKPPVYKPPVITKPPVYKPPVIEKPPVYKPPVIEKPPVYKPPVIEKPPVYKPPVITKPPVYKPPVIKNPPIYKPPVYKPPVFKFPPKKPCPPLFKKHFPKLKFPPFSPLPPHPWVPPIKVP
ncbi:repetitive proline-rich cell wall protein 2-like [Aristolochia californica]|uniref:repetitive proline-rich cell wall protein 2-like n=1 Tax=Aristolochia californica TaxID=171875 RepID=UPI0035DE7FD7